MSLDVYLTVPPTEPETVHHGNITHNLNRMAEAAGIYKAVWRPEEIGATKARDVTPWLVAGLARLRRGTKRVRHYIYKRTDCGDEEWDGPSARDALVAALEPKP